MASPDLAARLRFLNEAAHLLAVPAPETSRHLMSKHNALVHDHNLDTPEQRPTSCGACGAIMVPGWEGRLEMASNGVVKRQNGKGGKPLKTGVSRDPKAMVYTCDSCGRTTQLPLDLPAKPTRNTLSSLAQKSTKAPEKAVAAAPSNVKKRAKSKKGGLAAILAKQKESQSQSTSFGLNLMDFMKKS